MLSIDLNSKTAVVTGGTSQLGRVMVRTLGQAGADVVVHYHRNEELATRLVGELEAMGRRGLAVQADVTDAESVAAMASRVREAFGRADIIVNNAVSQYQWKPVLEQDPGAYEDQFRSCVLHNVLMVQAFVPAMVDAGWGRVIGISTECAMQCYPTQSAYAAAKRGMDGVFRTLAREIGPKGITANQVAPGWTISENVPDAGTPPEYLARTALGRRGTDQEIANVVTFLASDLASFITGAYIPVCGGHVMPGI